MVKPAGTEQMEQLLLDRAVPSAPSPNGRTSPGQFHSLPFNPNEGMRAPSPGVYTPGLDALPTPKTNPQGTPYGPTAWLGDPNPSPFLGTPWGKSSPQPSTPAPTPFSMPWFDNYRGF